MKKMYVFSLNGIVYAVDEDGNEKSASGMYGFTNESKESQEKYLIDKFKELNKNFEIDYTIVRVISDDDKEELSLVIKKLIDNEKRIRPNSSDIEYWGEALSYDISNAIIFNSYNKEIWYKINPSFKI